MRLDPSSSASISSLTFVIHDLQAFPLVLFRQEAARPGYAVQWEAEMRALLARAEPFVVIYDQLRTEETHEDRKHRGLWLKHHKAELARWCKALISIEPEPERRAQVEAMAVVAVKAFGIPHACVATSEDASRQASVYLADAVPNVM